MALAVAKWQQQNDSRNNDDDDDDGDDHDHDYNHSNNNVHIETFGNINHATTWFHRFHTLKNDTEELSWCPTEADACIQGWTLSGTGELRVRYQADDDVTRISLSYCYLYLVIFQSHTSLVCSFSDTRKTLVMPPTV